jgi:hypothetical protein
MLPRAPVAVEEVTQHTTSKAARLRGTETIVIVEDDPGVRQSTARILREHGYGAIEVENAKQALDAVLESNDARLVLADIVMPGMGGRRLAEQISIVRPDLHVLLMTGYPEQEAPEPSLPGQAPLPDILAKPYTPIDLLRRIRQILDS